MSAYFSAMKAVGGVLAAIGLTLGGLGSVSAQDVTRLRISMHQSSASPEVEQIIRPLKEFIETRSGGKLKVEVYPNAALHGAAEGFKALVTDVTDLTPTYPIYQSRSFGFNHVSSMPMAFPNAYVGARVNEELYGAFYKPEWDKIGVYPLFYPVTATYDILSTKEIKSLADLKGMKIRGGGDTLNRIIESLGASPITVPSPEVYMAFQQGVVDAVLFNTASILSFRLDEIGKYYMPLGLSRVGIPWSVNPKTFQALSPDLQKVIFDAGREGSILYSDYVTRDTGAAVEAMRKRGIAFVELSAEELQTVREAITPMWDDFIEKNGPQARELVTALRQKVEGYGDMDRETFVRLQHEEPVKAMWPGR
ncbi:MAG: TRAP transporter substrate-binding protein DctP [Pseudomonadota bacterium]|nr:TRAP transporter substrate-binding protein DctP [Pseudomonadota bacterium]